MLCKCGKLARLHLFSYRTKFSLFLEETRNPIKRFVGVSFYSTVQEDLCNNRNKDYGKLATGLASLVEESSVLRDEESRMSLAQNLASLVEETSIVKETKRMSRMEQKRFLERQIKKKVKEQYMNGKFKDLMAKLIGDHKTLRDAYDCIRLNSNVDLVLDGDDLPFEAMAEELSLGHFDVSANTYSIATRGPKKEVLILPNVKLRVVQEAIRIVLEVVYRPHFSKISHGCRSGRSHLSALRFICKDMKNANWWFTLPINKKLDDCILTKLISVMEDKIEDPSLFAIIRSMFDCQVLNLEFGGFPKGHGLPQEGSLSPILMNIYLDLFDREMYRMSMRYEALDTGPKTEEDANLSKLRSWFRRQMNGGGSVEVNTRGYSGVRVHSCRFMDEIFISVSGHKEVAVALKSEMQDFLKNSLHLEADNDIDILSCDGHNGIRFLGCVVKRSLIESPALKAVHKLKEKVKLFALQKQEAWDAGTIRIGKKCLAHGLKKVKESEIKHLADNSSTLSKVSHFRKAGMETDHWFKVLLKVWMQDINAKSAENQEFILSKHLVEPSLPHELRDSFYEFQKCVDKYISSETASTLALLPNANSSSESAFRIQIIAPINAIKKRLYRYGLTNSDGFPHACHTLVFLDHNHIIDWFSGIVKRLLRWYTEFDNFNEVKLIICNQLRMSCIRTLAVKYRIHEKVIEKKFDSELSRIPSTDEVELELGLTNEASNSQTSDNDDSLTYGLSYSGICLLSLARTVSQSRPCNCFVTGCLAAAPCVYTLHVMERQKFPGWKTGFSSCIHPSLHRRRIGLCNDHLRDLFLGNISLQSIDFGSWR
nr:nuclear intron maturase 4, mitochondrial [Ipomoea batatas]